MIDSPPIVPREAPDQTTAVRQGKTLGSMRWVLLVSMITVVIAFLVAFAVMPMP